jgi:phage tail sheath protein FI
MPEYLAPGVYVEEVSFRSKSIEGVPTSTTGFVGMTRTGPVWYPDGPSTIEPRLITSFTEFERVYGGLEPLVLAGGDERVGYLAHAARAFFLNGGKRLYVSRVFRRRDDAVDDDGVARLPFSVAGASAAVRARWPGRLGNVKLRVSVIPSGNIATATSPVQANGAKQGAVVEILPSLPTGAWTPVLGNLAEVVVDPATGLQQFRRGGSIITVSPGEVIRQLQLRIEVLVDAERRDVYDELAVHPDQKRYVGRILDKNNPEDEDCVIWLDWDSDAATEDDAAAKLLLALRDLDGSQLTQGHDGDLPAPSGGRDSFAGEESNPDVATEKATGLAALGEIDDIAIVAMPDAADLGDVDLSFVAHQALIAQCENLKYRIAVVDGPPSASLNEIRAYRGRFDSKYAAIYHPWVEILDPNERASQGAPPRRLLIPPSGFVTGIYARSDIERGVHKAPANEVVRGLTKFEVNINKGRQDVLNPEGINALRFFEGRGHRVWGARTMSSDPEWKYVNVRRLFIYLEHSIDKSTQWAVFEPNNERLWANIRYTIEDFLFVLWKDGALLGSKPEEAYFVRCDRTTMTQNDIDNGRMICLVGVAPVKPAEFVIFRVGQWTAGSKLS